MHILEEWRIRDIEQKADESRRRLREVDTLYGDVGRLESAVRELRAEIAGLRDTVEAQARLVGECYERQERDGN